MFETQTATLPPRNLAHAHCAAVLAALAALAGAALAQSAGQGYRDLRPSLLSQGWKPDASYGLKLPNGKPMHRFPEVLCGPARCNAKWRDQSGEVHLIWLTRGGLSDEYRVAPQ